MASDGAGTGVDEDADDGSWWPAARRCPSPNCDARPPDTPVSLALLHSISLPPGVYGGDEIERLFLNTLDWQAHPYFESIRGLAVSAHLLIRRDGSVLQFVDCRDRAWHAGASVWQGRERCNDHAVGIELEGLEGDVFDDRQYAGLTDALRWIARHHPLAAVAGHEHVAPGRKHDPGPGFDWPRLRAALGWNGVTFAA